MDFVDATDAELVETAVAAGIFAGSFVLAAIAGAIGGWLIRHLARPFGRDLGDGLASALRRPIVAMVVVQGFFAALETLSYIERETWLHRAWLALTIAILVIAAQRVLAQLLYWYAGRPVTGDRTRIDPRSMPLVRRALSLVVWLAGGLVVLDTLQIAISPLLAGLGIGGIAVALALQPLLANVFASSYMLSDQSIRIGDYVQVQGGASGVIEDIGWRATRLRSAEDNVSIVPNSVLAGTTVTNYSSPHPHSEARVTLTIAADADLASVEAACLEEMRALRDDTDSAVRDAEPSLRYEAFEGGGVQMLLRMRSHNWRDAATLRHLLIVRVHARLTADGVALK